MLKYAMLGLLAERDGHGWDLQARFEALLAGTWPLNNGQVYATLKRLENNDLVTSHVVEQDDRPDRNVFSITAAGREELENWLTAPPPPSAILKDEFFLKVLLSSIASEAELPDLLRTHRQHYYDTLATITRRRLADDLNSTTKLLLDGAIRRLEADLQWLDDVELSSRL